MKIHFYLDRRKGKTVQLPVFMQFWLNGQLFRTFTGEHCDPEDWDIYSERIRPDVNNASEINRLLQSMQDEVLSLIRKTKTVRAPLTISYLKENLSFLNSKERDFFSLADEFIRTGYSEKKWGIGMVKRLEILKMHLRKIDKNYKVSFQNINENFYKVFLEYNSNQGFNISYLVKNLELLRCFLNWASLEGYNRNMTYRTFKSPAVQKADYEEIYLTEKELMKICQMETDDPELEVVKDMFCLCCFTGLRYSDVLKLENKNLTGNKLIVKRQKPPVTIEIPLIDITRNILNKYNSDPDKKLFPSLSIQEYNSCIKELGRMAGIHSPVMGRNIRGDNKSGIPVKKWKLMSSLCARRTFIKLGVNRGIGLEVMSDLTGNQSGTIRHYYKISDAHKETQMQKLNIH
jgi:integrase